MRVDNIGGPFSRINYERMNLSSDQQVKKYLLSQGWVPTEYNRVKDKETGEWRTTSPKLTEDSFGSVEGTVGPLIVDRNVLMHRRNFLENFDDPENRGLLSHIREDGRVPAEGILCRTPTGRTAHRNAVCNVPGVYANYGAQIRELYGVEDPFVFLGADLSAIEARIFGHYTWRFDGGAYAKILLDGDVHSNNARLIDRDRNTAKSFMYATLYGAGKGKLAAILGCSPKRAQELIDSFWEGNPGLSKLKEALESYYKEHGFIKGLDGRKIFIRQDYKLLNSLVQTAAGIVFKKWGTLANKGFKEVGNSCKQVIAMHDEFDYRCCPDDAPEAIDILHRTCREVGEYFKIRVPIAADCLIGFNWREVH